MFTVSSLLCLSIARSLSSAASHLNGPTAHGPCKTTPNSTNWPSQAQWNTLNASIAGQLLAPLPPAAVCDRSLSVYDSTSCASVASQYTSSDFHARDPVSVDEPNWENDACLPDSTHACDVKQFPVYVVNATVSAQVQAAVNFGRLHNVRLIVKGTGHDYLGRSTAPDSLSIWTHNLRGTQWHDSLVPQGCSGAGVPALTAAAGHRMGELYDTAAAHKSTIVGGEDPDVGIGGYFTGGGHSLISAHYGLAADNILEFQVVTPSGSIEMLNECSNTDLFFAFRGGGGSTFGVIISATFKVFPIPSMAWSHFTVTQYAANTSSFWQAAAYFHSQLPDLVRSRMMGYYNISATIPTDPSTPLVLAGGFWILNASVTDFDGIFNPILAHMSNVYPVVVSHNTTFVPSLYEWWKVQYPAGAVAATDARLGSRLLDEMALSQPLDTLADGLSKAYPGLVLLGNLVSGPGVWNAQPPGGLGSMTPAWRKAVTHLIVPVTWNFYNESLKQQQTSSLTNVYMASLRRLAPDSGCYLNEADVNEPNLSQAYWGENYPRLLNLKQQVDPDGVFWCAPCVGGEEWALMDGKVCRTNN